MLEAPIPTAEALPSLATPGVTYVEIRWWARWLQIFTASDLADAMGVDHTVGRRGIKALLWHGVVKDTGELLDGADGSEPLVEYDDPRLLPGPTEAFTYPPEWRDHTIGCYADAPKNRGMPVRIRTDRDQRKLMSTPGARHKIAMTNLRYERHMEAVEKRKAKPQKEPKWKRKRGVV